MPKKQKKTNSLKLDLDYYENVIIYNALTDETYLASIIDNTKPCYFKNANIKNVFSVISDYYKKRGVVPNASEVKSYLKEDATKQSFKTIIESFKDVDKKYNQTELYESTESFLKERALYEAIKETVNEYSNDEANIDTGKTLELFEGACNISLIDDLGLDYFNEVDRHIADINSVSRSISTGYKWLDKLLDGGLREEGRALYVFSGVTNVGKSIVLGNLASNLTMQGLAVPVITLEMSEAMYAQRISSQLSKIPISQLKNETSHLKEFIENCKSQNPRSNLYFKEFPPKSVTVNHIKAYLKKLTAKRQVKLGAIVIDYVNLLQPTVVTGNSYTDVKLVTEQLRALSYIFKCPVVTATQLNRGAFGEVDPGLETTGESMGLTHTADAQFAIWSDDSDRELGIIHLGVQKNRFGPAFGQNAFRIDYDTLSIDELDEEFTSNEQLNDAENSLETMLGNLK